MVGAYGPDAASPNGGVVNDVHIFSALAEQPLQTLRAPDPQPGAGFGTALAPLGDLNGDGFQDYAIGAGGYDAGANDGQGRIYLFRSDDSPAPPAPRAPEAPAPPRLRPGPPGAPGPSGPAGRRAVAAAGRSLTLVASRTRVPRRGRVRLRGLLEAFADPAGCRRRPARRDPAPAARSPALRPDRPRADGRGRVVRAADPPGRHGRLPRADRPDGRVPRRDLGGRARDRDAPERAMRRARLLGALVAVAAAVAGARGPPGRRC